MRNRLAIDGLAGLTTAVALAALAWACGTGRPPSERKSHEALGQALATEAVRLRGQGGQVTVITRDTAAFPQPSLDFLRRSLERELRRSGADTVATLTIQTDPLRPIEVPSGDFYELLRRAKSGDVIISLLGPPLLAEDQRTRLGTTRASVVAFCPGPVGEIVDLNLLFAAGLLHAAVVSQPGASARGQGDGRADNFDSRYRFVRARAVLDAPRAEKDSR